MWKTSDRGWEKEAEKGKTGGEKGVRGRKEIKARERKTEEEKERARPAGRVIWPDCHLTGGI